MNRNASNLSLWFGITVSLALHLFVLAPLLLAMMTTTGRPLARTARFDPSDVQLPLPQEQPDIKLGLDDGTPSTLTWLGYREYEQHQAPPSEVEQAAFTDEPPVPPLPPAPLQQPGEQSSDQVAPDAPQPNALQAQQPAETDAQPTDQPLGDSGSAADAAQPNEAAPILTQTDQPAQPVATTPNVSALDAAMAFAEEIRRLLHTAAAAPTQGDPSQAAPGSASRAASETSPASSPPDSQAAPPTEPTADPADMDADPSSVVDVPFDEIRLGKPLAARGMTLRPQKPSFTTLTLMTAAPKNPLAEIEFSATGAVHDARLVESSRDERVDHAIVASLFRWRADGEPIEALTGEATITVRIRIILTRRPE